MHSYLIENAIVYGILAKNRDESHARLEYKDAIIDYGFSYVASSEKEYVKIYCGDWSGIDKSTLLTIGNSVDYLSDLDTIKVKGAILEYFLGLL